MYDECCESTDTLYVETCNNRALEGSLMMRMIKVEIKWTLVEMRRIMILLSTLTSIPHF